MYPYSLYKALIDDVDSWCRESQLHSREKLADVAGVSPRVVYNWLELREDEQGNMQPITPIPVAKLKEICNHIKRYTPLVILNAECGHLFVPIPKASHNDAFGPLEHFNNVLKKFGECVDSVQKAWADRRIDDIEAMNIEKEGREAMAAIQGLIEWSKLTHQGGM